MATIRDIAKKAEVSTATVSRVLNGSGWVSDDLKHRVHEAVEELGYRPSTVARSLSKKSTNVIALVVPDIDSYFFPEILRSVEHEADRRGYSVILGNSANEPRREQHYISMALEMWAAGIILTPTTVREGKYYDNIVRKAPLIVLDRQVPNPQVASVSADHYVGARIATQYLVELGHSSIAFIKGLDVESANLRFKAYCDVLAENKLPIDPRYIVEADFGMESGRRAVSALLGLETPPTAVLASNDMMAIGALKGLKELGVRVPKDVSVIGYDDVALSSLVEPALTTVAQPIAAIGRIAAKLLIDKIEGKEISDNKLLLPVHLVERDSCSKPGVVGAAKTDRLSREEG